MTQGDFERVRSLIHRYAGITLSEGKRAMVESALDRAGFHIDRRLEHRTNDASWWGLLASR